MVWETDQTHLMTTTLPSLPRRAMWTPRPQRYEIELYSKQTNQAVPITTRSLSHLSICCFWDPYQDSIHQYYLPKHVISFTLENKSHANHVHCRRLIYTMKTLLLQSMQINTPSIDFTHDNIAGFTKETPNNIRSLHITQRSPWSIQCIELGNHFQM